MDQLAHSQAMVSDKHTLQFANRRKIVKLVESVVAFKRDFTMALAQSTKMNRYTSVITDMTVPIIAEPVAPTGANGARLKAYEVLFKKFCENIEEVPQLNSKFVVELLGRCDHNLKQQVIEDPTYMGLMTHDPIQIVQVYQLVLSKAICEAVHKPQLRNECVREFRGTKLRSNGETISRFIARFNDTHSFGINHLGMTAVPDEDQQVIFLESINSNSVLSEFWRAEIQKSDPTDAATNIASLQKRLVDWSTLMRIDENLSSHQPRSAPNAETSQLGLAAQGFNPRSRSTSPQGLKLTGPKDQTPSDDRIARGIDHIVRSPSSSWNKSRFSSEAPSHRGNGFVSFQDKRSDQGTSRPKKIKSGRSSDSKFDKKKSLFTNSNYRGGNGGGNETYAAAVRPIGDEPMIPNYDEFHDAATFSNPDEKELGIGKTLDGRGAFSSVSLSQKHVKEERVLCDSGCVFNAVNSHVPKWLISGPFSHHDENFSVQAILGKPKSFQKVTVPLAIGQTAIYMKHAPVSIFSMTQLLKDYDLEMRTPDEMRYTSKSVISIGSEKPSIVTLEFVQQNGLFLLRKKDDIDIPLDPGKPDDQSSPDSSFDDDFDDDELPNLMGFSNVSAGIDEPRYPEPPCTDMNSHESHASLQGDPLIHDTPLWPNTSSSDHLGYDHSPLVHKDFVDAISNGEPTNQYTKRELQKMGEAKTLKQSMRGISDGPLRKMVASGTLQGCKLNPKDIDNAQDYYGNPNLKGRLTEVKQEIQISPLDYLNPKKKCQVYADIMKLTMTSMFLICIVMPFNLMIQVPLTSTSSDALRTAFIVLVGLIQAYNHELKVVFFDLESGIRPLESWFLSIGVLLELTNAKTHVGKVERGIRTLKERLRVTIQNAIISTPKKFLKYLVQSTVQIMNYEVDESSVSGSECPATMFGLPPLSYKNLFPWMQAGEVPAPVSTVSNSVFRSRTDQALALAPHRPSNGIHVWLLDSKAFALRDRFFPKPMTETTLAKMKVLEANSEDIMPDLIPFANRSSVNSDEEFINPSEVRGDFQDIAQNNDIPLVDESPIANDDAQEIQDVREANRNPSKSSQSYKLPWTDKKNVEFDKFDDWEPGQGKGRFRYEEVKDNEGDDTPVETQSFIDGIRRSTRSTKAPSEGFLNEMGDADAGLSAAESADLIKTRKALAQFTEINQLIEKDTLIPIMTPKHGTKEFAHVFARLLNLFMITKEKTHSDGTHDRWKARYVLDGSKQSTAGYDAKSLSAPTPSDCIIFLFIAIAAYLRWILSVIDVSGAFLNSSLLEGSFVYARIDRSQVKQVLQIRPEWKRFVNDRGDIICKVNKGLYGLREAPLLWSRHLKDTLVSEAGYTQNSKEACVYSLGSGVDMTILIVFVDDILILSKNNDESERLQAILKNKYGKITTQVGEKLDYLGMEIRTVPDGFEVTQVGSVEKLLDTYDVVGTKPTPGTANFCSVHEDAEELDTEQFEMFRSIVFSLLYIARRCRPDIHFHVAWLTSRMVLPTEQDLAKLYHLLKYLKGTISMGVRLVPRDHSSGLSGMIDASHGLHCSGHGQWGLTLFWYGMCVLCISRKLKMVTRSSCESEILGVNEGGVYILYIRELMDTLGFDMKAPTVIYQDNESAIGIMTGEHKLAMSSKHIHLRNLWIMDYINRSAFTMVYRETKLMTADILGKSLVGHLFQRHRYGVMNWRGTKPKDDPDSMFSLEHDGTRMSTKKNT